MEEQLLCPPLAAYSNSMALASFKGEAFNLDLTGLWSLSASQRAAFLAGMGSSTSHVLLNLLGELVESCLTAQADQSSQRACYLDKQAGHFSVLNFTKGFGLDLRPLSAAASLQGI